MIFEEDDDVMVVGQPVIGAKMQRVREVVGKPQKEIAIELGVTQQCVSEWEKSTSIKRSTLNKYAGVLGVTPDAIINFEEKAPMQFFTNCEFSGNGANSLSTNTVNQIPPEMIALFEKFLTELKNKR